MGASRFAATSFDNTTVMSVALSGNLTFNIFVILVLSILVLGLLSTILRAFWLDHSVRRRIWLCVLDAASVVVALLKVVRETCTLSILMLLLQSSVILITLTRDSRQLLLRLRDTCSSLQPWLTMLILTG